MVFTMTCSDDITVVGGSREGDETRAQPEAHHCASWINSWSYINLWNDSTWYGVKNRQVFKL